MNLKRLLLAFTVTALIIGIGIYYQSTHQPSVSEKPTDKKSVARETKRALGNEKGAEISADGEKFTIPGRVKFPSDVDPQSIRVSVEYFRTKQDLPRSVLGRLGNNDLESIYRTYKNSLSADKKLPTYSNALHQKQLTTDATGEFELNNTPVGIYRVKVASEGWGGMTSRSYYQSAENITTMQLTAIPGGQVAGQVVDNKGNPIEEAKVSLPKFQRNVKTNDNGQFQFSALPTDDEIGPLLVKKSGYLKTERSIGEIELGTTHNLEIQLQPKGNASLTVRVKKNGNDFVKQGGILLIPRGRMSQLSPDSRKKQYMSKETIEYFRNTRWYKSLSNGKVVYEELSPGPYQISHQFSKYVANPQTTRLGPNEDKSVTLEANRGSKVTIKFVNKDTQEPLRKIRPTIRAFTEDGKPLSPGFQIEGIDREGVLKGIIDPRAEYLKVTLSIPGSKIPKPRTLNFSRDDFPSMTAQIALRKAPFGGEPFIRANLDISKINLPTNSLETIKTASVHFWDAKTGVLMEQKKGDHTVLENEYKIKKGNYWVLGTLEGENENYAFMKNVSLNTGDRATIQTKPVRAASLDVRVGQTSEERLIRMGIAPFKIEDPQRNDGIPGPREYPFNLIRVFDEDRTTFKFIPPNRSLQIITRSHKGSPFGDETKNITTKNVSALDPGENRTIFVQIE